MANIQHRDIPDAQRHEPKGASTAAAGTAYVSNGAGSGAWATADALGSGAAGAGALLVADGSGGLDFLRYQGWGQFEDSRVTLGTPTQVLTSGARTLMLNNGALNTVQKSPSDLSVPLWDVSTNKHVPISAFDTYHVRIGLTAEGYAGATPYIDIELDIGGSIGVIYSDSRSLRKGGAAQRLNFSFPVFTGDTYFANGGSLYLTYQGTGTCTIYRTNILIIRESKNFV